MVSGGEEYRGVFIRSKLNMGFGICLLCFCLSFAAYMNNIVLAKGTRTHGTVVDVARAKNSIGAFRPLLRIKVADTDTTVVASLDLNSADQIPKEVSFLYSGDPSQEVYLEQETNPGLFTLFSLEGFLMLAFLKRRYTA